MRIRYFLLFSISLFFLTCGEDEDAFGPPGTPRNLELDIEIVGQDAANPNGDGSGLVIFRATADNGLAYRFDFSDGTSDLAPGGRLQKQFTTPGVTTYSFTLTVSGSSGDELTTSGNVTVAFTFTDDEALALLTGDGSRTWYWAADQVGHLGVGQNDADPTLNFFPNFYRAQAFEKGESRQSACLYRDELVFSREGDQLKFTLHNDGQTYFNAAYLGVAGGSGDEDRCFPFSVPDEPLTVTFAPSTSVVADNNINGQTRGTTLLFPEGGFMSYYVGASQYEILSLTADQLVVRAVQGNNTDLAWYHTFTTTKPTPVEEPTYNTLVWSDEFNTAGPPDPAKWSYNIGQGDNGWGNGEAQYYTDDPENVRVEAGNLKITLKRENINNAQFSSARIVTEDKYEFTYGRIEIRAKLPTGGGTWPALWMLGEDYATNTWPACGEIDIMEHVGNQQNRIFSSLHYPNNFGGNAATQSTVEEDVSTAFHVYSAIWSPNTIRFYLDDTLYHTFENQPNLPFGKDFFLIFNVAMGGNFGGAIAPEFQESTMEVDYVRVYQ